MPDLAVFEETGEAVDLDTLEHGDIVYDVDGNELVYVEDDVESDDEVGKAGPQLAITAGSLGQRGAARATAAGRHAQRFIDETAARGRRKAGQVAFRTRNRYTTVEGKAKAGLIARDSAIGAGGLAAVGGGGYAASEKWGGGKSLGDAVLEELSKAVNDRDKEEIIIKMAGEVEVAQQAAFEAIEFAKAEQDVRYTQEFIAKAATYNLPVSPEVLGPILKAMAEVLDEDQLDVIDELFNSVGDALYNEIGYVGESSNSSVIDAVDAYANELVGKSDLTAEQAFTATLSANPAAYDAYISEKGN